MIDYKKTWRERTRAWAVETLGGICAVCGSTSTLEFDHVDPDTKTFDISEGIRDGYGKLRLAAELKKCQLLCIEHHLEKSILEGAVAHGEGKSGKSGCKCLKCKVRKSEYMKNYHATHTRKRDRNSGV